MVRDDIDRPTNRSPPLSESLQVMVALRFYATRTFQSVVDDIHMISKASVSRTVYAVSGAIAHKCREFISMPTSRQDLIHVSAKFRQLFVLPNCFGAVDCTHIHVKALAEEEKYLVLNT